jgi:predicted transcriptional regulator
MKSKIPASKKQKISVTKSKPVDEFEDDASSEDAPEQSESFVYTEDDDEDWEDDDDELENDEFELEHDGGDDDDEKDSDNETVETADEDEELDASDDEENDADDIIALQNKALKDKKKKKKAKAPRAPGLDVEETQNEMRTQIASILNMKVNEEQHLKSIYPILAKAKGKSRQLLTQHEKWKEEEHEEIQKKKETDLILNQSHHKPTIAQYMHERELNAIATQGVIKLLNQVVEAKRKSKEKEKEKKYDAYEILKKFEGNKYLQV